MWVGTKEVGLLCLDAHVLEIVWAVPKNHMKKWFFRFLEYFLEVCTFRTAPCIDQKLWLPHLFIEINLYGGFSENDCKIRYVVVWKCEKYKLIARIHERQEKKGVQFQFDSNSNNFKSVQLYAACTLFKCAIVENGKFKKKYFAGIALCAMYLQWQINTLRYVCIMANGQKRKVRRHSSLLLHLLHLLLRLPLPNGW